jgi:hypothetical protein
VSNDNGGWGGEYTEEEKELIRTQLREGNRRALEVAIKRGVKVHPRVAAIKARALNETLPISQTLAAPAKAVHGAKWCGGDQVDANKRAADWSESWRPV